jgi:hypothetical protein
MKIMIVVEGKSDAEVLQALLPSFALDQSEFYVAGDRTTLVSFARTLFVKHRRPLAVLIDSESLDPGFILELVNSMKQLLRALAGSTPVEVIHCIPELEAIFFEAKIGLRTIFPLYDEWSFLMFSKFTPKKALQDLFENGGGPKNLTEFLNCLTPEDVARLQGMYQISQIVEFIHKVDYLLSTSGAKG